MLKRIGFDRVIKLDWLNKTAMICANRENLCGLKSNEVKTILDEYLEGHVSGENKRKTINILIRTWVNTDHEHIHIRDSALELIKTADENEKPAIHWCMLMLAYPIFLDVVFTIGKLIDLQNGFSLSMVRRRIYEIWGERSTLKYAIDKIVRSITEWGVIEDGDKSGDYKRKEQFTISNSEVKLLLIEAYLTASKRAYLQFMEVNKLHELFPFKLDLGLEDFHGSEIFSTNKMGMDIVIGLGYKR